MVFQKEQCLAIKLIVTFDYNFTQYFLLEVNFNKFTIELHLLLISFILAEFLEN